MISTLDVETVRLNPQEADGAKNEENASSKQHPHPTEPEAIAIKQAAAQNVGFIAFSGAAARARAWRLIYFLLTKAGVSSQNDILQLHKSNCSRRQIYLLFIFIKNGILQPAKIRLLVGTNKFGSFDRLWVKIISWTDLPSFSDNCLYTTGHRCINGACLDSQVGYIPIQTHCKNRFHQCHHHCQNDLDEWYFDCHFRPPVPLQRWLGRQGLQYAWWQWVQIQVRHYHHHKMMITWWW